MSNTINITSATQYFFQKENARKEAHSIHIASKLLASYFQSNLSGKNTTSITDKKVKLPSILTSKFHFSSESTKVTISFYYYLRCDFSEKFKSAPRTYTKFSKNSEGNISKLTVQQKYQLSLLSTLLSTLFGKQVDLCITQLHYPYLESTILAQYLSHNAVSSTFLHFQEAILSYPSLHITNLPSSITGVKIQLAGRILTEPVVPRLTVKSASVGTFSPSSQASSFSIDYGSHTMKNQLGSFTIKV